MQTYNRTKTVIALVMAVFMLASFTGCADLAQLISPTPTLTATPTATPEPLIRKEGMPITFGQMSGNSYVNEYFDVAVDLDDLWFTEDTKHLDEINGFAGEVPYSEREQAYSDLLNNGNMVREFYAHSHTGLKAISIDIYDYSQVPDQYPDIFMHYISGTLKITQGLKDQGYSILNGVNSSTTIAGETQYCFYFSYEKNGTVWNCAYVLMNRDKYVMSILFSSMVTNHVDEMIGFFHKPVQKAV